MTTEVLTPAETLIALGQGKKLGHRDWAETEYIYFDGYQFRDESGGYFDFSRQVRYLTDFYEHIEPKSDPGMVIITKEEYERLLRESNENNV